MRRGSRQGGDLRSMNGQDKDWEKAPQPPGRFEGVISAIMSSLVGFGVGGSQARVGFVQCSFGGKQSGKDNGNLCAGDDLCTEHWRRARSQLLTNYAATKCDVM